MKATVGCSYYNGLVIGSENCFVEGRVGADNTLHIEIGVRVLDIDLPFENRCSDGGIALFKKAFQSAYKCKSLIVLSWKILITQVLCLIFLQDYWRIVVPMIIFVLLRVEGLCVDKRVTRFHSVEHMLYNCLNSGKKVTKENLLTSSRFSVNCSSTLAFCQLVTELLVVLLLGWTYQWWLFIPFGSALGFVLGQKVHGSTNFMARFFCIPQLWLCQKPTDHEIDVAVVVGQVLEDVQNQGGAISEILFTAV